MSIEEFRAGPPIIVSFGTEKGPEIGEISQLKIHVADPPGHIALHIYKPADWKEGDQRPLFCNYHGGGWVIGVSNVR